MKKISLLFFIFILATFTLSAFDSRYNLFSDFTEAENARLDRSEVLEARSNRDEDVMRLSVKNSEAWNILNKTFNDVKHSFTVGVLQFAKYPDSFKNLSDDEKKLEVFNRMLQISTIKGLKYCSASSGYKEKTLFSGATMLKEPKVSAKIADPSVSVLPESSRYFAYLTDTKFGGNIYIADYKSFDDEIYIEITNYETIRFMGAKCIDPEGLHMFVDIKFMEEGIAVLGFASAYDTPTSVPVLFKKVWLDGAFNTRIKAMKDWMVNQMSN